MTSDNSREYPARPICGVGVVIRKDDAVLLIQRGNPPRRGDWGLPGGAVELGETLRDAARREVREECGIEIGVGEMIDAFDLMQRDDAGRWQYHYIIVDFAAAYVSGNLRAASDVLDARWVAINGLGAYALPAKTREVIDKAIARRSDGWRAG
ncbi:MAG: NUDIX hydrolase [Chloroflexota bacterium]|nr:NUDIX hydrolase [Chloroflexota bacterium]